MGEQQAGAPPVTGLPVLGSDPEKYLAELGNWAIGGYCRLGPYADSRVAFRVARETASGSGPLGYTTNTPTWEKLEYCSPYGNDTTIEELEHYEETGEWPERKQTEDGE